MRLFTFCFLICGGMGGFNTFLNLFGFFQNERTRVSYIDYITLANTYGFSNMTSNISASTWISDIKVKKTFYYFFDFGYSALIVFWIFIFKVFSSVIKEQI